MAAAVSSSKIDGGKAPPPGQEVTQILNNVHMTIRSSISDGVVGMCAWTDTTVGGKCAQITNRPLESPSCDGRLDSHHIMLGASTGTLCTELQ